MYVELVLTEQQLIKDCTVLDAQLKHIDTLIAKNKELMEKAWR